MKISKYYISFRNCERSIQYYMSEGKLLFNGLLLILVAYECESIMYSPSCAKELPCTEGHTGC